MNKEGICVFGSLNIDLTVSMERFHVPGETVTGKGFHTFTGGKGGNQAVAAARLGGKVRMIARLGQDSNGDMYKAVLEREHIDTAFVRQIDVEPSGVALIEVDDSGENRIVIVPGSNALTGEDAALEAREAIETSRILLLQLETPLPGVLKAAHLARDARTLVILDPAPARPLPDELLAACDYITPNETELTELTSMPADTDEQAVSACRTLLERGAGAVLHKRGARGAMLVTREGVCVIPGYRVKAIDTTAAGDTFNAGFAAGLSLGWDVRESIRLANAAAGLSTTALGAQGAMPDFKSALALMNA